MKKNALSFLLCLFGMTSFTQTLTVTDGTKEKTFQPGAVYEMVLMNKMPLTENCCEWVELTGVLSDMDSDSMYMNLTLFEHRIKNDDKLLEGPAYFNAAVNYNRFARSDLFSFRHFKSEKARRTKNTFNTLGGVLLVTGLATAINSLVVSGKDARNDMLMSAGIQGGVGIGFLILGGSKEYVVKGEGAEWKIK